jgi:hypothetical protein
MDIKEHDIVETKEECNFQQIVIPKGSRGTVVHIYPSVNGKRYFEVEFTFGETTNLITQYAEDELKKC